MPGPPGADNVDEQGTRPNQTLTTAEEGMTSPLSETPTPVAQYAADTLTANGACTRHSLISTSMSERTPLAQVHVAARQ
jgi:hypothetical protein